MVDRLHSAWPPGIRAQLALLYVVVFFGLFLLFSGAYYAYLQQTLASSFDATLRLRTEQIASGISTQNGAICIQDVTGELPGLTSPSGPSSACNGASEGDSGNRTGAGGNTPTDVTFGTLVRILNAQGQTVYVSAGFRALVVPQVSVTHPLRTGSAWDGTAQANSGTLVALYSAPLTENGQVYGVVQVGQPLTTLSATLRSAALALIVSIPLVLLVSAAGSYWLARRALRPIVRLTRTARGIEAADLHLRVPVPRARDEIRELAQTLNDMIARLDRSFAQQRRFVADASHELRTPVAAIQSMTDVALEGERDETAADDLAGVLRNVNLEAERLGRLISDLLALARADEGQVHLDHVPIRLDHLAQDAAASLGPRAAERGIALATQANDPVAVMGDEARLIAVVLNLLDNALAYTPPGGTVRVAVTASAQHAQLIVADTGIGIAAEHLPHIFERFYRADESRAASDAEHSGLGLAITDWVVRAHGGTISVESRKGQGTTFTVRLPLATLTRPHERGEVDNAPLQ